MDCDGQILIIYLLQPRITWEEFSLRNGLGQVGLWAGPCGIILVASWDENVGCTILWLGVLNNPKRGNREPRENSK